MTDFDAQQPVRAIATQFTTEVANATGTTINPSEDYAQGSTTSGQNGVLSMAAVTTAVPTYTTGTTNPLSMDVNGNLRVAIDSSVSEQNVNLNQVGGTAISLGQKVMASSLPVTIASDQSALTVNQGTSPWVVSLASTTITGTVAVTQSTSPWVVSGTVTSNIGTTGGLALDSTVAKLTLAQGSATSGETGALMMGAVTTAAPTYVTGTSNPLSLDTAGNLRVTLAASSAEQNVNLNQVGGAAIALGQTTMSASLPVTLASNQTPISMNETQLNGVALGSPSSYGTSPGAVSVQGVNAFITNTVPVTLASTTITGTVAVTQSTSPWVVSLASTTITGTVTAVGNLTNNNAAPAANNIGVLPAVAAAAAPTWTSGDQVLLSEDLAGNLRVITGTGSTTAVTGTVAVTQSTSPWVVSGTVTANAGTGNFSENLAQVNGSTVVTAATGVQKVGISDSAGASITIGQKTMANSVPVVLASDQGPINVVFGGVTPVVTYATTASVASNASATQSVAGPIVLDSIHASASGEIKVVVAIGTTGSEVTKWVGFTSASSKNFDWQLPDPYTIPTGSSVKITITNFDKQSMDVYSSVVNH